jgi:Heat shock protein. Metallo peptidase. MEROPS family M48B
MGYELNLKIKMIIAGIFSIIAEALVVYLIVYFLGLPLFLIFVFLGIFWLIQWIISPYLVGRKTFEVKKNDPEYGLIYEMVEEAANKSKVKMPKVLIADEIYPNAFAYGNYISGKRVAITKPLLRILNKEELKAVIAHEVGHIKHFDVELGMTIGLIPSVLGFISNILFNLGWTLLFFAYSEVDLIFAIALLALGGLLFLLTFFIQVFVLWFNRLRESYADLNSVKVYGNDAIYLASALAKIQIYIQNMRIDPFTGIIITTAPVKVKQKDPDLLLEKWLNQKVPFYIDILQTHPHPAKRVQAIYKLLKVEASQL